jgi:NDP-sugar pyrophosphorylase family protein
MVTYGDSYLPVDFGAIFNSFVKQSRPALMVVNRNAEKWDTSNACYTNGQVTRYEKNLTPKPPEMQFIDYGLLAFRRDLIAQEIPSGAKQDLAGLLNRLSVRGDLAGFEVAQRFYEIGSPQGLEDFKTLIANETQTIERKKRNG